MADTTCFYMMIRVAQDPDDPASIMVDKFEHLSLQGVEGLKIYARKLGWRFWLFADDTSALACVADLLRDPNNPPPPQPPEYPQV